MIRLRTLFLAAIAVLMGACAAPPPPVVVPQGEARFLIDPRIGWSATTTPQVDRDFEAAWRYILTGNYTSGGERLDAVQSRNGDYGPAFLARAAIAIREKRFDDARAIVDPLVTRYPKYTAASVYQAELDLAQDQLRSAYDRYRVIAADPAAPATANERIAELQTRLFEQLYSAALTARDADAIRLLREALTVNPAASAARVLLAEKLVAQRRYDEARRELEPVLSTGEADRPEVQESLAEIDAGKGRYQQAINRYERLSRRDPDGHYARRLAEIKQQFAEANMPAQFVRALETETISRADLAVLLYWKVTAIRFAQDVPAPPIATDIGEVPGRDELIRSIALGIFSVDPITRRVNPFATVNAAGLARTTARVLSLRGASCAHGVPNDAEKILRACGIDDPAAVGQEVSISGRTAAALLDQLDRALH